MSDSKIRERKEERDSSDAGQQGVGMWRGVVGVKARIEEGKPAVLGCRAGPSAGLGDERSRSHRERPFVSTTFFAAARTPAPEE